MPRVVKYVFFRYVKVILQAHCADAADRIILFYLFSVIIIGLNGTLEH